MNIKRLVFGPSVIEIAEEWRVSAAHGDIARYHLLSAINRYMRPFFGGKSIRRVSRRDAEAYIRFLRNVKGVKNGAPLSEASVKTALKNTKAVFNYAIKNEIIKKNPFNGLSVKLSDSEVQYYNIAQARTLMSAEYPAWGYRLAVMLGLCAGLRRGEIVALRWDDIDMRNRVLHIRHSMNRILGKNYMKLPKSGKQRTVPINDLLYGALLEAKKYSDSDVVVPVSPGRLSLWFPEFAESLGLPRRTFHELRKTFGTLLLQSGADVKTVSALLGHSAYQITLKYYAGVNADQIDIVNKIHP